MNDLCQGQPVAQTQSPYKVLVNDSWLTLEGVAPTQTLTDSRDSSELTTLGGHRYVQKSKRRLREWGLSFEWATPETISLAQLLAHEGQEAWLYDEQAASANLLDPTFTQGPVGHPVRDCGGIPLRSLVKDHAYAFDEAHPPSQTFKVPAGSYRITGWTDAPTNAAVARLLVNGLNTSLVAPAGSGWRRFSHLRTLPDSTVILSIVAPSASGRTLAGLGFTPATFPDLERWVEGQRASCRVVFDDPSQSREIRQPTAMGRGSAGLTIREVG